ncbi:cupin domain-containing protein [Paenactinomyces guangxiensis]|uniref:Cupin domain-containing protein n=1 Tax=Paenactinomyces guangxiensis TaxID=1490290 RepID=A0A7W1WN12_9BACL|nr:cupin domain-containing protein [Paenactinomyces guangxiensis]MBA4492892.1 cupin domain-containing protein [Paenactinomyces guangxiensis]MBH8590260.1 cupin domain-containing protein [Paenactinomyces guangxiensis]
MNKPYVIRTGDRDSIPMGCGVKISYLRKAAGEYSVLLQMESGGQFPVHEHIGGEEIFVIDGQVKIGDYELNRGDYFYTPPGFSKAVTTRTGCTLLICSTKGIEAESKFSTYSQSIK